jgi:hypothetical protein
MNYGREDNGTGQIQSLSMNPATADVTVGTFARESDTEVRRKALLCTPNSTEPDHFQDIPSHSDGSDIVNYLPWTKVPRFDGNSDSRSWMTKSCEVGLCVEFQRRITAGVDLHLRHSATGVRLHPLRKAASR